MSDAQIRILTIAGIVLALNSLFPPMIYENASINNRPQTGRHFFSFQSFSRQTAAVDSSTGKVHREPFVYEIRIDLPMLVTESFIIIGLACAAIGLTWPERKSSGADPGGTAET